MSTTTSETSNLTRRSPWQIQRSVLFALLQRELKARFEGRWLGAFWIFLEPIAHVAVLMAIFGYFRHRLVPGVPFPLFLLTGLIPYFIFRSLSIRVMGAIDANRGLFGFRQVKPIDTLIARGALETLIYSVVFIAVLAALGWAGYQWFPDRPLEVVLVSLTLVVCGFSLGLLFSILTDDLPQLRVLIRVAYFPLYVLSGVIFPVSTLPAEARQWLLWNPVLHLLELLRANFFLEYHPAPEASLRYPASVALTLSLIGLALYRVRRHRLLAS